MSGPSNYVPPDAAPVLRHRARRWLAVAVALSFAFMVGTAFFRSRILLVCFGVTLFASMALQLSTGPRCPSCRSSVDRAAHRNFCGKCSTKLDWVS